MMIVMARKIQIHRGRLRLRGGLRIARMGRMNFCLFLIRVISEIRGSISIQMATGWPTEAFRK